MNEFESGWELPTEAEPQPAPRRSFWRPLRDFLLIIAFASLVFLGTRSVAQGREIKGPSMLPTFHEGQRVFVTKYFVESPGRGDVIVFHPPVPTHDDYIKRVIGVPGDHVEVHDGAVIVNGEQIDEPYVHGAPSVCGGKWCDVTLGPGQYYVMGDNRPNSSDSRYFGPISSSSIDGKAWLRFYPLDEFKLDP